MKNHSFFWQIYLFIGSLVVFISCGRSAYQQHQQAMSLQKQSKQKIRQLPDGRFRFKGATECQALNKCRSSGFILYVFSIIVSTRVVSSRIVFSIIICLVQNCLVFNCLVYNWLGYNQFPCLTGHHHLLVFLCNMHAILCILCNVHNLSNCQLGAVY